jgi:hypothetical protein
MKTRRTFLKFMTGIIPFVFMPKLSTANINIDDFIENEEWKNEKFRLEATNYHSKTVYWNGPFNTSVREFEPGWERYLGRRFVVCRSFEMVPNTNISDCNMAIMQFQMKYSKTKEEAIKFSNRFKE